MKFLTYCIVSLCFFFSVSFRINLPGDMGNSWTIDTMLLAAKEAKIVTKTVIATLKDINAYEGSMSLIFTDASGKDIWFSHFDINLSSHNLYQTVYRDGAVIPQYQINKAKQGKKFKITYREEKKEMEYSGEVQMVPVMVAIEEIR